MGKHCKYLYMNNHGNHLCSGIDLCCSIVSFGTTVSLEFSMF